MSTAASPDTIPAGTVVVGVDGSGHAHQALEWAADQAALEHRALTLAHAIPPSAGLWLDPSGHDHRLLVEGLQEAAQVALTSAREQVRRHHPDLPLHELVRVTDPRDLLLGLSRDAAYVVLGSRGRGPVRSLLLGSVGVAVVRHAHGPVVVHRPGHPGAVRNGVLAGVDGSPRSTIVLEHAFRLASQRDLPLTVMYCYWDDDRAASTSEERLTLAETMAGMGEKYPEVRVTTRVERGMPDVALVAAGDRMNAIVVGTHHGGAASAVLFGSVSAAVVEHATTPVMVVPVG